MLKEEGEVKLRKNSLWIFLIVLLILSVLNGLSVNMIRVSAQVSPYIAVIPESTWNTSLTPGENYTVSIYTDYNETVDVWGYEFTLYYDPNILNGTEVTNGDLIATEKDPFAAFTPGTFDNEEGFLSLTKAWFFYFELPPPVTYGPGILANVTFTVVGEGFSDITLGDETKLKGYTEAKGFYNIIDDTMPDHHKQHGFFSNIPPTHDVAVVSLVAPDTATAEQPVPINVTVANNGTYNEDVSLTVYNETTVIGTTSFTLEKGLNNTVSFSWDTSGVATGTYTINATATIPEDGDPGDNSKTKTITLELVHDVAVVSLVAPDTAAAEQPVPISVTVANEGSYNEDVSLTVYNETTVIGTTSFTLEKGPASNTSSFSWNTLGVAAGTYTINATATISEDGDPGDNSKTKTITLELVHDVAVVSLVFPLFPTVGQLVPINVTVANEGSYNEDVSLTVYNETTVIGTTSFTLEKGPASNMSFFSWDTSGLATAWYTINATATIALDEDLSDNTKTQQIRPSRLAGDIDGDGDVDPFDYTAFRVAFGSKGPPQVPEPDPNYNRHADLDLDGDVDPFDYTTFRVNFGRTL